MKLAPAELARFLAAPPKAVRGILIYGPEGDLVQERALGLAKLFAPVLDDPFAVTKLAGEALAGDPARLHDEAASPAFGGGRRLVWVRPTPESAFSAMKSLAEDWPPGDSVVLLEAGDLDKKSKLRALFEGPAPELAAVSCYVEEGPARLRIISDLLAGEGLSASREVMTHLDAVLPQGRLALRRELEKLALYLLGKNGAKGSKAVTSDDVAAILEDAAAADLDGLLQAAAGGQSARAMALLDRLMAEQTAPVTLLRAAGRYFMRLQLARAYVEEGCGAGEALKKLQPPVFWKAQAPMTRALERWPLRKIDQVLRRLYETESAVKKTGMPDETLCRALFLSIAAAAGGTGRTPPRG